MSEGLVNNSPVRQAWVNDATGAGINIAQRVMDCGSAGHILLSNTVADVLSQLSDWAKYLYDLGEYEVKHGVKVHLYNLYTGEVGNPDLPIRPDPFKQSLLSDKGSQHEVSSADRSPSGTTENAVNTGPPSSAEYVVRSIQRHKKAAWIAVAGLTAVLAGISLYPLLIPSPSLAVLPFDYPDLETEYLSDGITKEIIDGLSGVPNLKMMARSMVSQYKGKKGLNPQRVGRELGVKYVLAGAVHRHGAILDVQAELVKVADGTMIWSRDFNEPISDQFRVEITRQITEMLRLRLNRDEQTQLKRRYTENTQAYQDYLMGRFHWNKRSPDGLKKAVELFQSATTRDPLYALAYTGLADSYALQAVGDYDGSIAPNEAMPKSKAAAIKALAIDSELAEAHASLAWTKANYDWDWSGAEQEFQRAIKLSPRYATAQHWYGRYLISVGRSSEAEQALRRAQQLDSTSLIINTNQGFVYYIERKYDQAIEQYQKTLNMDPNFVPAIMRLGQALERQTKFKEAIVEYEKALAHGRGIIRPLALMAHAHAMAGRAAKSKEMLGDLEARSKDRYVSAYDFAVVHAGLGDKKKTLEWLDKAYQEHADWLVFLKVEPKFDWLRSDSHFSELLRRMGLAP